MAYQKPTNIDEFIILMAKADMRVKTQLAEDLVAFLIDQDNSIVSSDLGQLIDSLMPWLTGSHYKIAQRALEAFTELISRLGTDFVAYTPTILPHVVDRLGDSRDTVREKAQLLLSKLTEHRVIPPQQLLDKLTICFKHKNAKVREEFLQTIVNTLNAYGTQVLSLKSFIQPIVSLLGDPCGPVRDASIQTLVEIYKHVGDKLRVDLKKKEISATKMAILEQKFDEIKVNGFLMPSALSSAMSNNDELDNAGQVKTMSRTIKRTVSSNVRKPHSLDIQSDAGAVTMEIFESSFEVVPQITVFNQRDVDDLLKSINTTIGDKNMDWDKRIDALKKIRSLLMLNVHTSSTFSLYLKENLSISFLDILKELRSQVIREACITIAYMCKVIQNRLDVFCVHIFQELINLIQNSAKIISSASIITVKYVIKYTHAPKLIPIITQNLMQSKSKDIRATLCEVMFYLFEHWSTKTLEKFSINLKEALKKGIFDADNMARKHSRRNFWEFRRHFPDLADNLYASLDSQTQKTLDREQDGSESNGTNSMSASLRGSNSSLNSIPSSVIKRRQFTGLRSPVTIVPSGNVRSISALDTAAVQRARARQQYSTIARMKVTAGTASLQGQVAQQARAKKVAQNVSNQSTPQAEYRSTVRRNSGVTQSQPTSRSTSPSSRLYSTSAYRQTGTIPKKTPIIPRSLVTSRETSPTRNGVHQTVRRLGYLPSNSPRRQERPPIIPTRPVLAQKILQASREAETALADALSPDDANLSNELGRLHLHRKISRDESDESEASSVCSERSFDSFRRNDSGSWNGSRNKLDRTVIEDIDIIIQFCSSTHWAERKDGLTSLTQYLSEGKYLTQEQLKNILDLFRKMFMDSHTKVYALFLDTVNELIILHSNDLHDWLFILLTRLFNKLGAELLGSMHSKIWKTLTLVHEYFPPELQLKAVFRILVDAAQTPSIKTKIAELKFVTNLVTTYCRSDDFPKQLATNKAIQKIIQLANDQKSVELRGQARSCLIALYNCNTPEMAAILSELPKTYSDSAKSIIQQHLRRNTSGTNSPSSPLSCSSPKLLLSPQLGPISLNHYASPRSRQSSVETNDGTLQMNTEEVYRNLRKTTAEIQNYSFETKLGRDTNSKDFGISQMDEQQLGAVTSNEFIRQQQHYNVNQSQQYGMNGHNGKYSSCGDKEDSCNGSKTQSAATTESNTPENTVRIDGEILTRSTFTAKHSNNVTFLPTGELITEWGAKESEVMKEALALSTSLPHEQIVQTLADLSTCIKLGNCELPVKHFKAIMKLLLALLDSQQTDIVLAVIHTLSKILRSDRMKSSWCNFLELILLKIIDCYKTHKDVAAKIDEILKPIASVLPVDGTINILNPVIATGEFPTNLCAIKLLTELVTNQSEQITDVHIDNVMPNIAKRTDDTQSMVRKAAVFCIVRFYVVLGEDRIKPKFSLLNSSKIRLLNVYIEKASNQKS
ncbi:CLIP-associating protein isoform X4 [Sitodiplosis mosellana]|uniref:CLIP-associating protein isoform X4 n=1 Tax=Sitodiplosis mosellana TaxID=263140 RepID=UPI002444FFC0|nr:CLIP-associating protein isoform X4 [Sitodiplosis mosellana]XP_055308768.1 CLIP-associating protein isoform X4 [Sitodiplosis mosellana]XP_055308769.1 CLIP-associating protein isoform X4 [Sitodiplosis mosellana]XP_055308770.1 CLIP-associating protein isoform X4 [Sitodiplosis mosellana]XP_055308771.1 CLIP-associating protein isoform X4 [Sitodiplosis mosellana]XP_055308772.1 CLIP-associating protein isoform X4 [Sitodiplosis mosellana]XP_055308773.1 CLIP-associating protein isoform X4 [Sitodip